MNEPFLYRGVWPQNVSKLAKYVIRQINGEFRVAVQCEIDFDLTYLAIEEGDAKDLIERVNNIKQLFRRTPGGQFYVNEYRHVIVPVADNSDSDVSTKYYFAGRIEENFRFEFEGRKLTTEPIGPDGSPLSAGDKWYGPRPGIPYVLTAGGSDIYYKTPALTNEDPPSIRPRSTQTVRLSRFIKSQAVMNRVVGPIRKIRGQSGGRFYVNENQAIFTPVSERHFEGISYIYCGQIDLSEWFPEPRV